MRHASVTEAVLSVIECEGLTLKHWFTTEVAGLTDRLGCEVGTQLRVLAVIPACMPCPACLLVLASVFSAAPEASRDQRRASKCRADSQ